jgi:hypothetical protein
MTGEAFYIGTDCDQVTMDGGAHPATTPMRDGTIYVGMSPDTETPMYAMPLDAPMAMRWNEAMDYAARFEGCSHKDWRLPTAGELNVLYKARNQGALKGTFNETGGYESGWYWSSAEDRDGADFAWDQRFDDGNRGWDRKSNKSSLRLVRG